MKLRSIGALALLISLVLAACGDNTPVQGGGAFGLTGQGYLEGTVKYLTDTNGSPNGGPVLLNIVRQDSADNEEDVATIPTDSNGDYNLTLPVNSFDGTQFTDWYVIRTVTDDFNGQAMTVQSNIVQITDNETETWSSMVYPIGMPLPPPPAKPQPQVQSDGSYRTSFTDTLLLYMLLYPYAYDSYYGIHYGDGYISYYYDPPRISGRTYATYSHVTNVTVNNYSSSTTNVTKNTTVNNKTVTVKKQPPKAVPLKSTASAKNKTVGVSDKVPVTMNKTTPSGPSTPRPQPTVKKVTAAPITAKPGPTLKPAPTSAPRAAATSAPRAAPTSAPRPAATSAPKSSGGSSGSGGSSSSGSKSGGSSSSSSGGGSSSGGKKGK